MGWLFFIILAAFCIALLVGGAQKAKVVSHKTWATIIVKIDDMQNCYLCSFKKDGKKITAIYCDKDSHKAGDEVWIIYEGDEACIPMVTKPSPNN